MKSILKNRNILVLGVAETVSHVGSWITMMAIQSIILFKGSGSVWDSSVILLTGLLPGLVFSPLAGKLVDKLDKKKLMIASELGSGCIILMIYLSSSERMILPLLGIVSAFNTVMIPARTSLVTRFINDNRQYEKANAFLSQLSSFSKIGGPLIAGALVGIMGAYHALILDMVSFGLSALLLLLLPGKGEYSEKNPKPKLKKNIPGAFSFLLSNAALLSLFILTFVAAVIIISSDVLIVLYVRDILGRSELFFGVLIGCIGIGNVCGGLIILRRKEKTSLWRDLKRALLLSSVFHLTLGVLPLFHMEVWGIYVLPFAAFISGIGISIYFIQRLTMIQRICPGEMIGTMVGYMESITSAGFLSGFLVVPVLVPSWIGMDTLFLICACILLFLWAGGVLFFKFSHTQFIQLEMG